MFADSYPNPGWTRILGQCPSGTLAQWNPLRTTSSFGFYFTRLSRPRGCPVPGQCTIWTSTRSCIGASGAAMIKSVAWHITVTSPAACAPLFQNTRSRWCHKFWNFSQKARHCPPLHNLQNNIVLLQVCSVKVRTGLKFHQIWHVWLSQIAADPDLLLSFAMSLLFS